MLPKCYFELSDDPRTQFMRRWISENIFPVVSDKSLAEVIIIGGGDGFFVDMVKKHCRSEIPFLGINCGTKGFLLNPIVHEDQLIDTLERLEMCHLVTVNLLHAKFTNTKGKVTHHYAFNDVYFNVEPGAMCYGRISGERLSPQAFEGDGIIIATAAGSTAYNFTAGGTFLPIQIPDILSIVTICPRTYPLRTALMAQRIEVIIDRGKVVGHADGKTSRVNNVKSCVIEPSGICVDILFMPDYDFEYERNRKLYDGR